MTSDPQEILRAVEKKHEFFIGIDSDGCAFDTMEIKHKECFCPNFVERFHCQAISKYTRQTWEFVNLYSKTRGCNRWLAVQRVLKLLHARPEVQRRKARFTEGKHITEFIEANSTLSNETMQAYIDTVTDVTAKKDLEDALAWSLAVNATIGRMVHDVPPFPFVRESLDKASDQADMIVVSQTPVEALTREWKEHDIDQYVQAIAGQEMGKKGEHIELASRGRYPPERILMIGDAPGDLKAARHNNALFYPVNPSEEERSWQRFHEEALDRFFSQTFAGDYEKALLDEFDTFLPEQPPWEQDECRKTNAEG